MARELNFDGIVGPTHNYAGLSFGNVASTKHQNQSSSPRQAALQGLEKMKFVHGLGITQAVLPPLRRPHSGFLRQIGFAGTDSELIQQAWNTNPALLAASYSASNMWTANAATVSPSSDCADGRLHMTPANLSSGLHRSVEAEETTRVLRAIFKDQDKFVVHDPLPGTQALSDEGAANHTRLCGEYEGKGLEMFVFGRSALNKSITAPTRFPARQTLEASQAIVRAHRLDPESTLLIQQDPEAIDAGVFHNDVISVGNRNFLMYHEHSFVNGDQIFQQIHDFADAAGWKFFGYRISAKDLPLHDAVTSYLFNSQLLSRPDGGMTLLCPLDAREVDSAFRCTQRILAENNPVDQVEFLDLRQSMNNGGGPACLRLRVVLTDDELASIHQRVLFNETLYSQLVDWVNSHYREELTTDDLKDPSLADETEAAFRELQTILDLPGEVFRF